MLKKYKELKVWSTSFQLCIDVYKQTKDFPREEKYGLASQMRRAAVSVPSNIAEGYGMNTTPDYLRALYIAHGSTCELETQVLLSGDLGYIENELLEGLQRKINKTKKMLTSLIMSLEKEHVTTQILESLSADRQA